MQESFSDIRKDNRVFNVLRICRLERKKNSHLVRGKQCNRGRIRNSLHEIDIYVVWELVGWRGGEGEGGRISVRIKNNLEASVPLTKVEFKARNGKDIIIEGAVERVA